VGARARRPGRAGAGAGTHPRGRRLGCRGARPHVDRRSRVAGADARRGAGGARRRRRRLPGPARPVGRGRHDPGDARPRRCALCRVRCARLGGRDGQALHEGRLRRGTGCPSARMPSSPTAPGAPTARPPSTRRRSMGFPVFVKPARAGSSMGITRVASPDELEAAIEAAREHDPKVLVEAAIFGREIECAVLEGRGVDAPRTSKVGEIVGWSPGTSSTTSRRSISPRPTSNWCAPPTCPTTSRPKCSAWRPRRSWRWAVRGWPGSTASTPTTGSHHQRDQHDARLHAALDVSPDVGRDGRPYHDLIDELIALAMERRVGLR
jgi:hypothetical protein